MDLKLLNISVGQNKRNRKENEGEAKFCGELLPLERKEKIGPKYSSVQGLAFECSSF